MYNNGDYPMGADDEFAPWNQISLPPQPFPVCVTQTLTKHMELNTDDYELYEYGYEASRDTDWIGEYHQQHYELAGLLGKLKDYIKEDLDRPETKANKGKCTYLRRLLEDTDGWVQEEKFDFSVDQE